LSLPAVPVLIRLSAMAEKADGTLPVVATKRPLPNRTLIRVTFSSAKKVNGMILTARDAG